MKHQNGLSEQWYVLYTKPRWEKKVAELLAKKGYNSYCPVNKVRKKWHDRMKTVLEPLFTSYVFVQANVLQQPYIKEVSGVLNFVYWLGEPAVVKDDEIDTIKSFLTEHEAVVVEKIDVNVSDSVTITHGPFIHREGKVVQVSGNSVKVALPSIGFSLVAKLSKAHIKVNEPQATAIAN